MPSKPDIPTSAISAQGMQTRFVRAHPTTHSISDKPRFSSRHRSTAASRLNRCLTTAFAPLRLRRSKRATALITVFVVAFLIAAALATLLRLISPRSLDRLSVGVGDVRAGVLDLAAGFSSNRSVLGAAFGGAALDMLSAQPPGSSRGDEDKDSVEARAVVEREVGSLKGNEIREKHAAAKMSIIVLFHNEYASLKGTLRSWIDKGLVAYADEILFFLNGVPNENTFKSRIPEYERELPKEKRSIHVSPQNLPLGKAITRMVELARHEYILLLEKDWQLIEEKHVMKSRLDDSKVLIGTGIAHLVRHRHRHNPGVPLHALIMHDGREEAILRVQKNLLCFVHHWQKDPTVMYPGVGGIMRRCGGKENNVEETDVYCSSSVYCQWTNNPGVFKKKWFIDEVGERFKKEYDLEFAKHGKSSPFLDFEYYTNWRSYAWTDKNFTVAVGTGLFSHAETEHRHFNTFWYAHYRLTVDMEEIRNQYLTNETAFKKAGGVHFDHKSPIPPTMMERYPVKFARTYHWNEIFTGTIQTQRELVNTRYKKFQDRYRVLSEEDWSQRGLLSARKASTAVDWRVEITALHHVVEKAEMIAPPKQPHEMTITLVTCLLDLGRDELASDAYQFKREFKMYLDSMAKWLTHKYPKVVYTSKQIADEMMKTMSEETKKSTKFVLTSRTELRSKWLGQDNYDKLQEIRKSKTWRTRASWLENSPQAGLQDYNPLVMSKMFMVRDAARQNYFHTSHFVFLDAKHNCMQPEIMTPKNDHIIRAHMFNKFLLTTFDYTPANEVHGFEYSAFNRYLNFPDANKKQLVKVGRGGIFGGSAFVIEYIAAMYDVALTATLREGLMGTEENILSILKYQVKQYVDDFSNNWACPDKIAGDHACRNLKSQGYNCAIFDWVKRNAVEWSEPEPNAQSIDLVNRAG